MKLYYQDNLIQIYNKDCRSMDELPDESVQCVITSPPYWGLRKYSGVQDLVWGDNSCEHKWQVNKHRVASGGYTGSTLDSQKGDLRPSLIEALRFKWQDSFCSLCGAWKGSYGLEPTPEMYIEHTIEILREIRRVLRKDGVVFWNIGDSYAGSNSGKGDYREKRGLQKDIYDYEHPQAKAGKWDKWRRGVGGEQHGVSLSGIPIAPGLKPKDLCLIPFRVAIAAQEDGWWVRSVIIWSKPNPMPESVTDRPTESHEYILMLTKSKNYYWDADAVREPSIDDESYTGRRPRNINTIGLRDPEHYAFMGSVNHNGKLRFGQSYPQRNIRSVWEFPTQPYPEAHFAVFPEKLPEICIKAATPEIGCCSKCGAPWERITKKVRPPRLKRSVGSLDRNDPDRPSGDELKEWYKNNPPKELGWQPTCKCNADKVPSIVLDPFLGSGTTLWVAKKLGRRAVGYELSGAYCALSLERNRQMVMELKIW